MTSALSSPDLSEWNRQVLNLLQSLWGAITPNFRAVTLGYANGTWQLLFDLECESATDREEIEEVEFEFMAYQEHLIETNLVVRVSSGPLNVPNPGERLVYRRKEP